MCEYFPGTPLFQQQISIMHTIFERKRQQKQQQDE